jgi:hypothetical protein
MLVRIKVTGVYLKVKGVRLKEIRAGLKEFNLKGYHLALK